MIDIRILGSGSAGNAFVIRNGEDLLMIDAGFSARELTRRMEAAELDPSKVRAILVTHEHDDHVTGLRVFAKKYGVPVFANALTTERLRYQEKAPEQMTIFHNAAPFPVGDFHCTAFSVSHDAVDPVGYIINIGDVRIGIATDFGHPGMTVPFRLKGCNAIVLEFNHCPELLRNSRRPAYLQHRILGRRGHLSNQLAAELVPQVVTEKTSHLVAVHLSRDCNKRQVVQSLFDNTRSQLANRDLEFYIASQKEVLVTSPILA